MPAEEPPPWARPRSPGEPAIRPEARPESGPGEPDDPPWARSRPFGAESPMPRRRLGTERPPADASRRRVGSGPPPGAVPPPGTQPPGLLPATPSPASDRRVGLIAGPIRSGRESVSGGADPGLVAVAVTAVFALAGTVGRLLSGRPHPMLLLLAGVVMPLAFLAVAVVLQRRDRRGAETVHVFTLRASDATTRPYRLRGPLEAGELNTGDLVRLVPGRGDAVRAIEVLAALDGPVIRRVAARPALPPVRVLAFILAAALAATTAAILLG